MRAQLLGIGVSLMVHGMTAMLLFGISQQITPAKKNLYIDFSLDSGGRSWKDGSGGKNEGNAPLPGASKSSPVFSEKRPPVIPEPHQTPEKTPPVAGKASPVNSASRENANLTDQKARVSKCDPSKPAFPKKKVEPVRGKKVTPNQAVQAVKEKPSPIQENYRPKQESALPQKIPEAISDSHDDFQGSYMIAVAKGFADSKMAGIGVLPKSSREQRGSGKKGGTEKDEDNSGIWMGDGESAYLKTHFSFIRGRLKECLHYPSIARKRGWSGKVMVAFTIYPDGRTDNINIQESCGNALLDKCALKTVRNACPFPRPPMTARIVIPILYQLN